MKTDSPERWSPLIGMPAEADRWETPGYAELSGEWERKRDALKKSDPAQQRFMDAWLRERNRAFAVETGQIEGLYTLRRGITEQLIAEGLSSVLGSHTIEGHDDQTIRGLLEDQEAAYDMMFEDVASGHNLSAYMIKSWHQLLTQHQENVTGIDPQGRHVSMPFKTRGQWKTQPNNPRRPDGVVHEYCPPEQVQPEMDRFFGFYAQIRNRNYPPNVEAAWLHHRFVRTHPFQDGNGRVSRLLMAWAFIRKNLPSPIITAEAKTAYITALEVADEGDLKAFSDHLGILALATINDAVTLAQRALEGKLYRPNGNGGRTIGDEYIPPDIKEDPPSQKTKKLKVTTRPP